MNELRWHGKKQQLSERGWVEGVYRIIFVLLLWNPALTVNFSQVRDPTEFRLILRDPPGCSPESCDIYVGIDTNPQDPAFLDFYIEGAAQAWVAVGFSESPNMVRAQLTTLLAGWGGRLQCKEQLVSGG